MTEEEFREYIDNIKDTEAFRKLQDFINFSGNNLYVSVTNYLNRYFKRTKGYSPFAPDYDYFHTFFELFRTKQKVVKRNNAGEIDLQKTPYLKQIPVFLSKKRGHFTDDYIILTDGSVFITKYPICDGFLKWKYNPIIATGIANYLGVSTSENFLAVKDGEYRILSKCFLNPGEELITFFENSHSNSRVSVVLNKL